MAYDISYTPSGEYIDFIMIDEELTEKEMDEFSLHTNSKAFDISTLTRFKYLKELFLSGYKKNIETLSSLKYLAKLTLAGVSLNDMSFLNKCTSLKHLEILRGNAPDFTGAYGNKTLKAVQLIRINNLYNLDFLPNLPNLEVVELIQLKHIERLPNFSGHTSLKHIYIDDMKSLTNLSSLEFLKTLKSVSIFSCSPAFEPECILPVLKNPSVKQSSFYTSSKQKNEKINAYIQQYNKKK